MSSFRRFSSKKCIICGYSFGQLQEFATAIFNPLLQTVNFCVCSVCLDNYCPKGLASRVIVKLYSRLTYWTDRIAVSDPIFLLRLEAYAGYFTGDY